MKLSNLIANRESIIRIAHLTYLAVAYDTLNKTAERMARAGLTNWVNLTPVKPEEERFFPSLVALTGNQSVIEEHFAEDELVALADAISVVADDVPQGVEFRLDAIRRTFADPLREKLEKEGVELDGRSAPAPDIADEFEAEGRRERAD